MLNSIVIQKMRVKTTTIKYHISRGQPGGAVVKFAHSALTAWGSPFVIPGADMALLVEPCCGRRPTYKVEEDGHRCWLRASLPQQKEKDWQHMLAQG